MREVSREERAIKLAHYIKVVYNKTRGNEIEKVISSYTYQL